MWEILYGKPVPFELKSKLHSKLQFQIQVCVGLRPHIYENTANCYADLIKKCWNAKPEERPTATEICGIFAEWQNSESILFELDMQVYIDSHYKSCFISSNNDYKDSKLCELEVPDIINK
ncbi:hypothetical protein C2G38_2097088 [Gigaspora rosea]|uniref:Serine-threonine/tyrosine-protein kinase catalytic domain-containing protein n=1 Tax=Gigaspora rosea TaxID=44941 RepID=A0A397UXR1_9GLOM|nr:hypothetical protein C2G38_2097088 [Gigaspora rosea]